MEDVEGRGKEKGTWILRMRIDGYGVLVWS